MNDSIIAMGMGMLLIFMLISVGLFVLMIYTFWRIFARTGMSGALSLLMLVPIANIVMIFILAFAEWPIEKELQQWRAWYQGQQGGTGPGPGGAPKV